MNERQKRLIKGLAEAANLMPDNGREFLLGFAEGVAAMASRREVSADDKDADDNA